LKEKARHKEEEKRLLNGRLARAGRGLRRFLAFAGSRAIQRIAKTNERLNGKGQYLLFHALSWNVIGMGATSQISFFIGSRGVGITMTNTCWMMMIVSAVFPYRGSEVVVKTNFAGRECLEWTSSIKDVLNRMENSEMTLLNEIADESKAALQVLGLWSRPAPFEKTASAFLEKDGSLITYTTLRVIAETELYEKLKRETSF